MPGDGDDVWEWGDRLHVNCHQSQHYGRYATVTAVVPTMLTVVFDDGGLGQLVDGCSVSYVPPLHSQHRAAREAAARQTRSAAREAAAHEAAARQTRSGGAAAVKNRELVMSSSRRTGGGGTDVTRRGESVAAQQSNTPP
jgi:hypothetical protein